MTKALSKFYKHNKIEINLNGLYILVSIVFLLFLNSFNHELNKYLSLNKSNVIQEALMIVSYKNPSSMLYLLLAMLIEVVSILWIVKDVKELQIRLSDEEIGQSLLFKFVLIFIKVIVVVIVFISISNPILQSVLIVSLIGAGLIAN